MLRGHLKLNSIFSTTVFTFMRHDFSLEVMDKCDATLPYNYARYPLIRKNLQLIQHEPKIIPVSADESDYIIIFFQ